MKTCTHCGTTNPEEAKFCLNCGATVTAELVPLQQNGIPSTVPPVSRVLPIHQDFTQSEVAPTLPNAAYTDRSSSQYKVLEQICYRQRKADIMFVLDCTGSMQGEIDAVRDAIIYFVESIEAEDVKVRVGLIEFRDRLVQEEHRVLQFNGHPFTNDPVLFRQQVSYLRAQGGGDEPESSLDAVMLALEQPFDAEADKVIVLITDAPPHIPDRSTQSIKEVMDEMRKAKINQTYIVMRTQDRRNQIYLKLLEVTRGVAFEIGKGSDFHSRAEDFKRTLMALVKPISSATIG